VLVSHSREEVSRRMGGAGRGKTKGLVLAAAAAFGGDRDPCRTAYLASGLSQQQVTFEEFGEIYGDGLCAPPGALARTE
jgi:hypothetical protein